MTTPTRVTIIRTRHLELPVTPETPAEECFDADLEQAVETGGITLRRARLLQTARRR